MKHGIYRIRNKHDNKCYIGSAASRGGLRYRWATHRYQLNHNKHCTQKLQRAWSKYGVDMFVFEVLLYCDPQDCLMYEQIALDHYKPEYNTCKVAGNILGIKRSSETVEKLRQSKLGSKNPRYGKPGTRLGKKASKEERQRVSAAHIGIQAGEKNPAAKLTRQRVEEIRYALKNGYSCAALARWAGVSRATISAIKRNKIWKILDSNAFCDTISS